MASSEEFVQYTVNLIHPSLGVTSKKMFGEYAIYCNTKVVALICDNKLFVKPTELGKEFIGKVQEAQAYPNAKPSFLITDHLDEKDWLTELIRLTESELPFPKKKEAKKKKVSKNKKSKT